MNPKSFFLWAKLLGTGVAIALCLFFYFRSNSARFLREHRKLEELYPRLEAAKPAEVAPDVWDEAWGWTQTAMVNVCSPGHVDINELSEFRRQLEQRSRQPIAVQTLCWIWKELERIEPTGRYGDNYVKRYKLKYLQSLARGDHTC